MVLFQTLKDFPYTILSTHCLKKKKIPVLFIKRNIHYSRESLCRGRDGIQFEVTSALICTTHYVFWDSQRRAQSQCPDRANTRVYSSLFWKRLQVLSLNQTHRVSEEPKYCCSESPVALGAYLS